MATNAKMDWKKVVAESNGSFMFLPEGFVTQQKEMDEMRLNYNKEAIEMAEKEIKMNVANQNFFLALREYFAKNGMKDIWVKELGFNADALREGVFILSIREPMRG